MYNIPYDGDSTVMSRARVSHLKNDVIGQSVVGDLVLA